MLIQPQSNSPAKIKVIGVGGAGCNAINTMISDFQIEGVEFIAVNTDEQVLKQSLAPKKVQIGAKLTKGLGAGGNPEIGQKAAQESIEEIQELVADADMVFITGGMGGGTGTGAIPVIAEVAKTAGALTVTVVTKPFSFEGKKRAEYAQEGIAKLKGATDTLMVIPNDKLFEIADKNLTFKEALKLADSVLANAIESISTLITKTGLINLDFADVKNILKDAGTAMLGMGSASGENRATEAAKQAINSPLLEMSIDGAKGILINIQGSESSLTLQDIREATELITSFADPNANIKFGAVFDETLGENIKIVVIAAGFPDEPTTDREEETTVFTPTEEPTTVPTTTTTPAPTSTNSLNLPSKVEEIPTFLRRKKKKSIFGS